jgi:hypothetical protein
MTCEQLHDIADDVAVGMLTGTERAAALFHLEHCADCREMVASLSVTADLVLLAAPASPPPTGFETRVLARIDHLGEGIRLPRRRSRRWLRPVLVAAALLAVLVVTLVPDGRGDPVSAAPMRTGDGTVVGSAQLRDEDTASIVVNVTDWQKTAGGVPHPPYRIAVDRRDGTRQFVTLGPQPDYSWQVDVPSPAGEIFGVALVDSNGNVLCSGVFEPPS